MPVEHVQTKREIEALLRAAGVRPRKRFGQHFLIDGNLMRRLVKTARLDPAGLVLEVGPGTGGLTDLLVGRTHHVIAVEIDKALHELLSERFAGDDRLTLLLGDVLESKHAIRSDVRSVIDAFDPGAGGCVKLVANLPYQIATPLIMNLLVDHPNVRRMCFTVQAEVGERLVAQPNCKAYGPLSVIAQTMCRVETVTRIGPQSFWPRPAVDSVMMRVDVAESPFIDQEELQRFSTFVRGVFDHRRKVFRSAVGYVVDDDARERVCGQFDATRRPESFCPKEWTEIFGVVQHAD
ncbi:MAG: ribosomal RNA small subunit methyltransferase A [Phycisphaerales bacterium]|nr:MAG: ribosomal RNA small subunit methyltransferase A [Phycisphaerales bacterium]